MFNRVQTVGSIPEFMGPDLREIKRTVKRFNKNKLQLKASLMTLATGATAITITNKLFTNTAFADGEVIPVNAIPVNAVTDIKNEALTKIVEGFMPLVEMIQALAYPIALVMLSTGAIMFMINQKERGISMIQQCSIGYLLVQMVPLFMKVLVGVGSTVALGIPFV